MRAIQITQFGNPEEVLRVVDLQEPPAPGAGEVKVAVEFSPLNKHDLLVVSGALVQPPLLGLHFHACFAGTFFCRRECADGFFLCLEQDGFLFGVCAGACFGGAFLCEPTLVVIGLPLECVAQPSANCAAGN